MTKKKINRHISKNLRVVKAYLKDLRYIENILKNDLGGEGYLVSYDGYSFDSLAEVIKENPTVQEIEFKVTQPYISISISKNGVHCYGFDSTFETEAVVNKVYTYFDNKRTKYDRFGDVFDAIFPLVGGALIPIPFLLFALGYRDETQLIAMVLVAVIINLSMFTWSIKRSSRIYYTDKVQNFFIRHKDKIILGSFFAATGAFITKMLE
jgi:hypothetical protein